ncbi:MAG: hypothetical protein P8Y42_01950 [Exilibacterium sp.]
MAKKNLSPLAAAVGAAFIASASLTPVASASDNPFAAEQLGAGYNLAAEDAEEKAGEGKCGEGKAGAEGKCGEGKAGAEGKCGEGDKEKAGKEGKCGEGKCGS